MKMPPKPKRPCSKPGCPELTTERYCEKHKAAASQAMPSRSYAKLYGRRWRKYREQYLALHPLCVCDECKGKEVPLAADVVDHIKPHKGNYNLFWDPENHQPMNKRCHDRKTAKEDGGFGHGLYNDCY
ncbi:HNH endonuclease signature motif containing protein [Paenibacillus melissococcoides]|uniref:HNH endonuclease signature motif containing protein n=1 Tax=Paenibacillus melissococcoides TaxID=2912268 RepID=UPI0038B405F9